MTQSTPASPVPRPPAPRHAGKSAAEAEAHDPAEAPFDRMAMIRIVVAAFGAAAVWFRVWEPVPQVSVIGVATLLFAGWPVFREAVENLLIRRMTMELSMTIAIIAAAAISELFTALVVTLFVLVAEELEDLTVARGRSAIRELTEFLPLDARVRRLDQILTIPVDEVEIGDRVLVSPGERLPVDGVVVDGHSYVDQSRITGESMPDEKAVGALVYAGSVNQAGMLEIMVERVGSETSYGRIVTAIAEAEKVRAPVQRLADRMAGYLVYFAIAAAVITYAITRNTVDTISVIIVAGACGIAAGTPLAILGAVGRAARMGAIIKGGVHVESLGLVDTVIFDKTGTLTLGEPAVERIETADGIGADELLALTAAAELHSEHPLAHAIVVEARKRGLAVVEPDRFTNTVGRGITAAIGAITLRVGNERLMAEAGIPLPPLAACDIGSQILVARDRTYLGRIVVADPLRKEAASAMRALGQLGIRTLLLTGDNARVGTRVGAELGIAEVRTDLLPQDKLTIVSQLIDAGRVVAMVGDGVNDAPALTRASVGIAMGSGTDVAQDSADVVLLGNDLDKLVATLRLAQRTRGIIWQNFAGTIGVDALGIALAATGYLNPLLAAFIHVGSELLFLANSARLLPGSGALGGKNTAQPRH